MPEDTHTRATKINQVENDFTVKFPYVVGCEIDQHNRTAKIKRMEVVLKDEGYYIPGGWRVKIGLLRGIDYRITLIDAIPLHTIVPGAVCPIGPCVAPEIPRDITKSKDEWQLELYIVDPYGNEACIFRSPSVSFAEEEPPPPPPPDEKIRDIPKEQRVKTDKCQLLCRLGDHTCRYLLYTKPTLTFGKQEENDLVFQLFPVNPENDRATSQISRRHGELKYPDEVWTLTDSSMNGTWVNDEYVGRNKTKTLHNGDRISIARVLELQFNSDDNYARISRLNNLADEEAYLFLINEVTIGSHHSNGIVLLSDPSASDFHAAIFHRDDEFWIRDVGSDSGTIIGDSPLDSNEICPLGKGLEFKIGKFSIKSNLSQSS